MNNQTNTDFYSNRDFIYETYETNNKKALEDFMSDTSNGTPLEVVLRSHLYFENALENALRSILENPDVLLTDRFTFSNKLALVYSLGVIPEDFNSVLKYFNKSIRNKFAHNLKFELKEEHVDQLINRFNKQVKKDYDDASVILKDILSSLSDLMKKLICCTYAIWQNIRTYHKKYVLYPVAEELNLLGSIIEIGESKDLNKLIQVVEERQLNLMQKLKEFSLNY
ncbi:hypothetical protein [Priestia megaterium]|uniref:hypothetical protein n=1 Tax=Priestia megaterium TaxID=1404 RepID=UPI000BFBB902|nr:hypothetical protein [Priestia megaterium]PGY55178.1 hypothetical protein COE35_02420 [Priestia megaterium]